MTEQPTGAHPLPAREDTPEPFVDTPEHGRVTRPEVTRLTDSTPTRMQVRFWMPDGSVVEYQPTWDTEVTEQMTVATQRYDARWQARDVTIHGVFATRHASGYLTPEQRTIMALEAEVERLRRLVTR